MATEKKVCNRWRWMSGLWLVLTIFGIGIVMGESASAQNSLSRTAGGLTVYLGVVPAGIVKGPPPHSAERPMHGRIPAGRHRYHVVAAVFDAATKQRVADAVVTAQVSGLGLSGTKAMLERMEIANTISYGAFVNLPGADLYTIRLMIERPGAPHPVIVDFKYDHRRL